MAGAHSILPPSGAAAWSVCAHWVVMNQRYPQDATPQSREGDAAHWVFAKMLAGREVSEGMTAPNGVYITGEMVDGGELMADTVRDLTAGGLVESRMPIVRIHPECFGTPDVWAFDPTTLQLTVVDYKFGHRFVDEFENAQGICYVAGALDIIAEQLGRPVGAIDQHIEVTFVIVQPRCYYRGAPVRSWKFRACDIRGHINVMAAAAASALGANPTACVNDACCDCPGRHACQSLQQAAYSGAQFGGTTAPLELTPEAAALELRMLERAHDALGARIDGLRESVMAALRAGVRLPWYRLEQGYGRQQWGMSPEQVIEVGNLFGVDLRKPAVLTPKQAVKAGIDEAVVMAYSVTPSGSVKLVPENPTDARRVFGK